MRLRYVGGMIVGAALLSGCQAKSSAPEAVIVKEMPALGAYSSAVKAGGMVYVAGIVAYNPKTGSFAPANVEAQTMQIFANLQMVLAAVGCDLEDVVKTSVYLKNPSDYATMNEVYSLHFPGYKPARTTVPGVDWGRDDILIEIDVIAKLP